MTSRLRLTPWGSAGIERNIDTSGAVVFVQGQVAFETVALGRGLIAFGSSELYKELVVLKLVALCNIAILVVDMMQGTGTTDIGFDETLRDRKTPFIVTLNKIDRLYEWKKIDNNGSQKSLAMQNMGVQNEFCERL